MRTAVSSSKSWLSSVVTTPVSERDEKSNLCQKEMSSVQSVKGEMPEKIEAKRGLPPEERSV